MKQHVKDNYAVIVIDNSDIVKPASQKIETFSNIYDGSTKEITKGYLIIEAEEDFISETHKNPECLKSLSRNPAQNSFVHLTAVLMQINAITTSLNKKNVLLFVQRKTTVPLSTAKLRT